LEEKKGKEEKDNGNAEKTGKRQAERTREWQAEMIGERQAERSEERQRGGFFRNQATERA
jgi:hypothetical protein